MESIVKGAANAPHRSLYHALGMTNEELNKPMIGIVSSYNEIVPGHMNLDKIVEAVRLGVAMAGGNPVVFPAIAVCDGIAMGHVGMKYSLVTRDLIADSTEAMTLAHGFDALVMVPNCDTGSSIQMMYTGEGELISYGTDNLGMYDFAEHLLNEKKLLEVEKEAQELIGENLVGEKKLMIHKDGFVCVRFLLYLGEDDNGTPKTSYVYFRLE